MFSSGGGGGRGGTSKRVTVLLVDEMDLLVTKKQSVCLLQQDAHMRIYLHAYTCLMRILAIISMFLEAGYAMVPCTIILMAHTPDHYRYAMW